MQHSTLVCLEPSSSPALLQLSDSAFVVKCPLEASPHTFASHRRSRGYSANITSVCDRRPVSCCTLTMLLISGSVGRKGVTSDLVHGHGVAKLRKQVFFHLHVVTVACPLLMFRLGPATQPLVVQHPRMRELQQDTCIRKGSDVNQGEVDRT